MDLNCKPTDFSGNAGLISNVTMTIWCYIIWVIMRVKGLLCSLRQGYDYTYWDYRDPYGYYDHYHRGQHYQYPGTISAHTV